MADLSEQDREELLDDLRYGSSSDLFATVERIIEKARCSHNEACATTDQWRDQRDRAEKAERERDEQATDAYTDALRDAEARAEKAEALAKKWYGEKAVVEARYERLRSGVERVRAEMVGMTAAGAPLVGRTWVIHRLDTLLDAERDGWDPHLDVRIT